MIRTIAKAWQKWRSQKKAYVSELDLFLCETRKRIPETDSQRAERQKHKRVADRRDRIRSSSLKHPL